MGYSPLPLSLPSLSPSLLFPLPLCSSCFPLTSSALQPTPTNPQPPTVAQGSSTLLSFPRSHKRLQDIIKVGGVHVSKRWAAEMQTQLELFTDEFDSPTASPDPLSTDLFKTPDKRTSSTTLWHTNNTERISDNVRVRDRDRSTHTHTCVCVRVCQHVCVCAKIPWHTCRRRSTSLPSFCCPPRKC